MDGHEFESPRAPSSPDALRPAPETGPPPTTPLDPSIPGLVDALLRSPARVQATIREGGAMPKLVLVAIVGLAATGFAMATWSGGAQLALVPAKLAVLVLLTSVVCLPSLHVLSALSGGAQGVRETAGAMSMGMSLAAVLALALAPIAWVLSAATSSLALAGTLYLGIFLIAAAFGLGLVRRSLAASAGTTVRGLGAWSLMFVIVALQLATTMRPLVGPFDGLVVHDRTFFLAHFVDCLGT